MARGGSLLEHALQVVRCPDCGAVLEPAAGAVCCHAGHEHPVLAGQVPAKTSVCSPWPPALGTDSTRER